MPTPGFQARPTATRMGENTAEEQARALKAIVAADAATEGAFLRVKLTGSTFAPVGQRALQYMRHQGYAAFAGPGAPLSIALVPEPTNEHDPDAVAVVLRSTNTTEDVKLGYLPNRERVCTNCAREYTSIKAEDAVLHCRACGRATRRNGVASKLTEAATVWGANVNDLYQVDVDWAEGGITGGGTRTHGLNLRISSRT